MGKEIANFKYVNRINIRQQKFIPRVKINKKEIGTAAQSKIGTDFQRRNRIPQTLTKWLRNLWQKIKQFLKKNCCNLTQYL